LREARDTQVTFNAKSNSNKVYLNQEPLEADFDPKEFLLNSQPLRINGIEISDSISDVINFDELKKMPNLRIKRYPDAIYFG